MELNQNVNLSGINQSYQASLGQKNTAAKAPVDLKEEKKKKIKKAIIIASAAAAAAGIAAVIIYKKKNLNTAKEFFTKNLKEPVGNNKILSENVQKADDFVTDFIKKYPEKYENIKAGVFENITEIKPQDIIKDGVLYHGTSAKNAKNIMQNGMTPFIERASGGSGEGLGRAIYTTPTLDAAKVYSKGEVVIPLEFKGNIAKINYEDPNMLIAGVKCGLMEAIEPQLENKTGLKRLLAMPSYSKETMEIAENNSSHLLNRIMQDLKINALYTDDAVTKGLINLGGIPEAVNGAGQIAIFDGTKIKINPEKLKELNPITSSNASLYLK